MRKMLKNLPNKVNKYALEKSIVKVFKHGPIIALVQNKILYKIRWVVKMY